MTMRRHTPTVPAVLFKKTYLRCGRTADMEGAESLGSDMSNSQSVHIWTHLARNASSNTARPLFPVWHYVYLLHLHPSLNTQRFLGEAPNTKRQRIGWAERHAVDSNKISETASVWTDAMITMHKNLAMNSIVWHFEDYTAYLQKQPRAKQ